jgi:hypothetical protein
MCAVRATRERQERRLRQEGHHRRLGLRKEGAHRHAPLRLTGSTSANSLLLLPFFVPLAAAASKRLPRDTRRAASVAACNACGAAAGLLLRFRWQLPPAVRRVATWWGLGQRCCLPPRRCVAAAARCLQHCAAALGGGKRGQRWQPWWLSRLRAAHVAPDGLASRSAVRRPPGGWSGCAWCCKRPEALQHTGACANGAC